MLKLDVFGLIRKGYSLRHALVETGFALQTQRVARSIMRGLNKVDPRVRWYMYNGGFHNIGTSSITYIVKRTCGSTSTLFTLFVFEGNDGMEADLFSWSLQGGRIDTSSVMDRWRFFNGDDKDYAAAAACIVECLDDSVSMPDEEAIALTRVLAPIRL